MVKRFPLAALVCLLTAPLMLAQAPSLDTEEHKTLYALGLAMSKQLSQFALTVEEADLVGAGFFDGMAGRDPKVELETYGPKIDGFLQTKLDAATELEKKAGAAFRLKMEQEPGAVKTDSGLIFLEVAGGDGESPTAENTVKVNYHGTFRDGSTFDRSEEGQPATFALNAVAPCFSEGLTLMQVGAKSKIVCPPELAYGDRGYPPLIPPGTTLVFEIELVDIVSAGTPAP